MCDATSGIHGIGKGLALKRIIKDAEFQEQDEVFDNEDATKSDIIAVGEKAIVCLYNGRSDESLDSLRYWRFCQKITTGTNRLYIPNVSVRLLQPRSTTASGFTTKYSSGEVLRSGHHTVVGNWQMEVSNP